MLKRVKWLLVTILLFWIVYIGSAWVLAKLYQPWLRQLLVGNEFEALIVSTSTWLIVGLIILGSLIIFRKGVTSLFWREIKKQKINSTRK